MDIPQLLSVFLILLSIALLLYPLARTLHIPYASLLAFAGMVSSTVMVNNGIDTGLRWDNFHQLVFYVLLPILIFEASLRLKADYFFENLVYILLLAIPLMLLSTGVVAVLLYQGIGYPEAFPWTVALITAAILSATDPSAVLPILRRLKVPERIIAVLEGEGLFSGAMAIVLVSILLVSLQTDQSVGFVGSVIVFAKAFTGGVFVGLLMGLLAWLLMRLIKEPVLRGVVSLVTAYGSFLFAENILHVSGIIAVVFVGLMLNAYSQKADEETTTFLHDIWEYKAGVASALLFLLLGISIQISLLADQWLAILIGIVATLFARLIIVFGGLSLGSFLPGTEPFSFKQNSLVLWGGLRGAVTIALVLSLPLTTPAYQTIQAIVSGVVLFTLFVQAPTLSIINRWFIKEKQA